MWSSWGWLQEITKVSTLCCFRNSEDGSVAYAGACDALPTCAAAIGMYAVWAASSRTTVALPSPSKEST